MMFVGKLFSSKRYQRLFLIILCCSMAIFVLYYTYYSAASTYPIIIHVKYISSSLSETHNILKMDKKEMVLLMEVKNNNETDPSFSVTKTDPSLSVAKTDPSLSVAKTDPSFSFTETDPLFSFTKTDPSFSFTKTDPSFSVAKTDPSLPITETDPSDLPEIKCHLPKLKPFDASILEYIEEPDPVLCVSDEYPLLFNKTITSHLMLVDDPKKYGYVECFYQYFTRESEDSVVFSEESFPITAKFLEIPPEHEFIAINCSDETSSKIVDMFPFVPFKFEKEKPGEGLNVVILGIDAVSHMNLIRTMPKSYKFLTENMKAIGMNGYTKIGDNTFPNVAAALLGMNVTEIEESCMPGDEYQYFDDCPFIWKDFSSLGYATSYAEDAAWMSGFNYGKDGFKDPPTDYYGRNFFYTADEMIGSELLANANLCNGPRLTFEILLGYMQQTAITMQRNQKNYFQFVWATALFHDELNEGKLGDQLLLETFMMFEKLNYFTNTIFILMSDHGARWGDIRNTYQGKIEERMPFLYFSLPENVRSNPIYATALANLKTNAERLSTPFDFHETLKDFLQLENIENETVFQKMKELEIWETKPRGISLLLPIPTDRDCQSAGIDEHWCVCHLMKSVSIENNTEVQEASEYAVAYINEILRDGNGLCAHLGLHKILSAQEITLNITEIESENEQDVDENSETETEDTNQLLNNDLQTDNNENEENLENQGNDNKHSDNNENGENPDNNENPEDPDKNEDGENPDNNGNHKNPDNNENSDKNEDGDNPDKNEDGKNPHNNGNHENPDNNENSDKNEDGDNPDKNEDGDNPDNNENGQHPGTNEKGKHAGNNEDGDNPENNQDGYNTGNSENVDNPENNENGEHPDDNNKKDEEYPDDKELVKSSHKKKFKKTTINKKIGENPKDIEIEEILEKIEEILENKVIEKNPTNKEKRNLENKESEKDPANKEKENIENSNFKDTERGSEKQDTNNEQNKSGQNREKALMGDNNDQEENETGQVKDKDEKNIGIREDDKNLDNLSIIDIDNNEENDNYVNNPKNANRKIEENEEMNEINDTDDNENIITDNKSDIIFAVTFMTTPGNATFEATVKRSSTDNGYIWGLLGEISRTNLYGNQSHCVHNYKLKKFCYCP